MHGQTSRIHFEIFSHQLREFGSSRSRVDRAALSGRAQKNAPLRRVEALGIVGSLGGHAQKISLQAGLCNCFSDALAGVLLPIQRSMVPLRKPFTHIEQCFKIGARSCSLEMRTCVETQVQIAALAPISGVPHGFVVAHRCIAPESSAEAFGRSAKAGSCRISWHSSACMPSHACPLQS